MTAPVRAVALPVLKRLSLFSHGLEEQTACPVNGPIALLYVTRSAAACVAITWFSASASAFAFVRSVELIPSVPKQLVVEKTRGYPRTMIVAPNAARAFTVVKTLSSGAPSVVSRFARALSSAVEQSNRVHW